MREVWRGGGEVEKEDRRVKRKKVKGKNEEGEAGRKGRKGDLKNAKTPEKPSGVTLFSSIQTRSLHLSCQSKGKSSRGRNCLPARQRKINVRCFSLPFSLSLFCKHNTQHLSPLSPESDPIPDLPSHTLIITPASHHPPHPSPSLSCFSPPRFNSNSHHTSPF